MLTTGAWKPLNPVKTAGADWPAIVLEAVEGENTLAGVANVTTGGVILKLNAGLWAAEAVVTGGF